MKMEFEHCGYIFKYFFDADVDELGHIDVEGYEVYNVNNSYLGEIRYITEEEILALDEKEIDALINT